MNLQHLATLLLLALPCFSYAEECQLTLSQQVVDYHQMRRDNIISSQQSWALPARKGVFSLARTAVWRLKSAT